MTDIPMIKMALDNMWILLAGFLVFFMQAGFALVETGFTRAKNVAHTMMMNLIVFCVGAIAYYVAGFAFQFGGIGGFVGAPANLGSLAMLKGELFGNSGAGILGLRGFFLGGLGGNTMLFAFFLFQMVFMDTAATIPTGAMAERVKFSAFVIMSLWVAIVVYPLFGNWVWGGGWLANLGNTLGLGHGVVDFAGSSVVHMTGGMLALAGAIVLGPRIGKFNKDGSANTIPGHNIPMAVTGTLILFFGWFGFNPGSTLSGNDLRNGLVATNTLLAGAAGGLSAMLYMWCFSPLKKPEAGNSINGVLAGLVAVTASCAFVPTWAAVIIGLVAGVWACGAAGLVERLHVDDPVGAIAVHGCNGAWGIIALGLFADGSYGAGWNGTAGRGVTGLFFGDPRQFVAQVICVGVNVALVFGLSLAFFKWVDRVWGLRVSREAELAGLDVPEIGTPGYAPDAPVPGGQVEPSPRKAPKGELAPGYGA